MVDIESNEPLKKGVRSRRKTSTNFEIDPKSTANELKSWICRKCLRRRPLRDYYSTGDPEWDTTGHVSICRFCVDDAFERYYVSENSFEKTILRLCKVLNFKFDSGAIEATKKQIETSEAKGKPIKGIFGIYRKSLNTGGFGGYRGDGDLSYQGSADFVPTNALRETIESPEDIEYFEKSWGQGFEISDYAFLEESYAKWTRTTEVDNYGVEILLRELCHKENEIRKARLEGSSVDGLVKSLQEIMKNSALTPALQNAASNGRSIDCLGVWIKDLEVLSPAEWWEDQQKYRDMDGITEDIDDIKRSMKNFATGSRDYNINDLEEINNLENDED